MRDAVQKEHEQTLQEHDNNCPEEIWTWRKMIAENARDGTAPVAMDEDNPVLSQYEALLQIKTAQEGFNSGRTYYIHAESEHHREQVVQDLSKAAGKSLARKLAASKFRSSQKYVRSLYESARFQIFVGLLILTVSPTCLRASVTELVPTDHANEDGGRGGAGGGLRHHPDLDPHHREDEDGEPPPIPPLTSIPTPGCISSTK